MHAPRDPQEISIAPDVVGEPNAPRLEGVLRKLCEAGELRQIRELLGAYEALPIDDPSGVLLYAGLSALDLLPALPLRPTLEEGSHFGSLRTEVLALILRLPVPEGRVTSSAHRGEVLCERNVRIRRCAAYGGVVGLVVVDELPPGHGSHGGRPHSNSCGGRSCKAGEAPAGRVGAEPWAVALRHPQLKPARHCNQQGDQCPTSNPPSACWLVRNLGGLDLPRPDPTPCRAGRARTFAPPMNSWPGKAGAWRRQAPDASARTAMPRPMIGERPSG
eukprot:CAMPEP_0175314716 /NCGR_PEP_ID=MMETSP0093-20121207/68533_1 /TAXON_ID=311494 /ORGANISM="Alexandrium monilatum, Strain CCMP3105" /LENGTH=274 /DNA_ID=CAMNT_0016611443 /DNA_START=14 /DNA_END=838 /DNA_ORIENTATION=-